MEDTEWTDILKKHGIIKEEPKPEPKEEVIVSEFDQKLSQIQSEDDLNDLDETDEDFIREYRNRRIAEMRAQSMVTTFGDVREITASDYVQEVNKAGQDIWVVLLLYQPGIPECTLMQKIIAEVATRHPRTKFLKSIASLCVANFPETSLPAVFLYRSGALQRQLIISQTFGRNDINVKTIERLLSQNGAIISKSSEESEIDTKSTKFYEQYDD